MRRIGEDFAPELQDVSDRVRQGLGDFTSVAPVAPVRASAPYESASTVRRLRSWNAPTISANSAILPHLHTLRDRSRSAVRNIPHAKNAVEKTVSNLVGTGIKPLFLAEDRAFRRELQDLWNDWTEESDADGLLDWYGQQTQAVRGWKEGGEAFVRLRSRMPGDMRTVSMQVQVIEPELCPHSYDRTLPNGNKIRAGIEFSPIGRRLAYWFHPSRPADQLEWDTGRLVRVPADSVIHMFDPLRAGQLRGLPDLTTGLNKLYTLDIGDDATLLRWQLSNLFTAFVTKNPSAEQGDVNVLTGLPMQDTELDTPSASLEPGIFQELNPGEDVKFSTPPSAGDGYKDFMRQQLFGVSAATGVPYEVLTGDMSGLNDRVVRVILHEFRRRLQAQQHQVIVFQLCRRVTNAWMDWAFLSDAIDIPVDYLSDRQRYARVKYTPQAWPYLHPVQDLEAQQASVRAGFTSRSAIVSEQGEDAEAIDQEQADDNARADVHGLKYASDSRFPTNGAAPVAPQPEPEGATA